MAYQSMYSATKSALIGLTGSLRYELWDENIRLSTVIPGTVATPMWEPAGGAPEAANGVDEYLLNVARKRRSGEVAV